MLQPRRASPSCLRVIGILIGSHPNGIPCKEGGQQTSNATIQLVGIGFLSSRRLSLLAVAAVSGLTSFEKMLKSCSHSRKSGSAATMHELSFYAPRRVASLSKISAHRYYFLIRKMSCSYCSLLSLEAEWKLCLRVADTRYVDPRGSTTGK